MTHLTVTVFFRSGEECLALGALCEQFSIPYVYDGISGYLGLDDL